MVPTRDVGSKRRRVSAPASRGGAVTHRARVRWDVDDGSARIDDCDDGDGGDYELSSSSPGDEMRPKPAADPAPTRLPNRPPER